MALTQVDQGLLGQYAQYTGFKNRIINGAMMIDQRNAGASGTATGYTVDRWTWSANPATKGTWQQNAGSVTPPTGYKNYWGFTSNSAYTLAAGEYQSLEQSIEGFNTADFAWGTASAATITISFWVRSSLTGTFGGALRNSVGDRSYPFTYTISSANTWEQKTVTIAGDTTGTWIGATNGIGIRVGFGLGVGSTYAGTANVWQSGNILSATGATSVVGTNGATFYITGVQLEKGSTATSFDYRPYGTELDLCRRYFQLSGGAGRSSASNTIEVLAQFSTPMRAAPSTPTIVNGTSNAVQYGRPLTNINSVSGIFMTTAQGTGVSVVTADTGLSVNAFSSINPFALGFSAEL